VRTRALILIAGAIAGGCNYRTDPDATRIEESKQVTAKDDAATELTAANATAKPRPVPDCMSSTEAISAPQLSQLADELSQAHDERRAAMKGPPSAAALEANCAFAWDDFELRLKNALFEHRALLGRPKDDPASPSAWADVDRRWNALASRGAELLDDCRRAVPGSPEVSEGLVLLAYANVGAERSGMAEAVMKRLLRYHPARAAEVADCYDAKRIATWRGTMPAEDAANPMRSAPEPTGIDACDLERSAALCQLRGELPKREKEAAAVLGPAPKELMEAKKCQARYERARAKLAGSSWCYLADYIDPAQRETKDE